MRRPLIQEYPEHYQQSPEMCSLQRAYGTAVTQLEADRDDLLLQLYPDTATWGLALWEHAYGIPIDHSKSLEQRRGRVKSKILGQGTSSVEMIRGVVRSFGFDDVDVIEHASRYQFELIIIDAPMEPESMDDVAEAICEIKPAHLDFWFTFQANPFQGTLRAGGLMWSIRETALPPL